MEKRHCCKRRDGKQTPSKYTRLTYRIGVEADSEEYIKGVKWTAASMYGGKLRSSLSTFAVIYI